MEKHGPFFLQRKDAVEVLLECLLAVECIIREELKVKKPLVMTKRLEKVQQGNEMPHLAKRLDQTELQRCG